LGELWGLGSLWEKDSKDIGAWKAWAENVLPEIRHSIEAQKDKDSKDYMDMELLFALNKLERDLIKLTIEKVRWVVERSVYRGRQKFTITPLWAAPLAERTLFAGIEKIVLTSATITEEVGGHLGLASESFNYIEMPSTFDAKRRPIIYAKFDGDTKDKEDRNRKVCLNRYSTEADYQLLVDRLDEFIGARLDRKGIVLPVSFDRGDMIVKMSKWGDSILHTHNKGSVSTKMAVDRFKRSIAPSVLCSRNIGTGYDFPYRECDYVVIFKIPSVPTVGAVMKARKKDDPGYPDYLTGMEIVQNVGRGKRAHDDQCEIVIFDGNWVWFQHRMKKPKWFRRAMRVSEGLPEPMVIEGRETDK